MMQPQSWNIVSPTNCCTTAAFAVGCVWTQTSLALLTFLLLSLKQVVYWIGIHWLRATEKKKIRNAPLIGSIIGTLTQLHCTNPRDSWYIPQFISPHFWYSFFFSLLTNVSKIMGDFVCHMLSEFPHTSWYVHTTVQRRRELAEPVLFIQPRPFYSQATKQENGTRMGMEHCTKSPMPSTFLRSLPCLQTLPGSMHAISFTN